MLPQHHSTHRVLRQSLSRDPQVVFVVTESVRAYQEGFFSEETSCCQVSIPHINALNQMLKTQELVAYDSFDKAFKMNATSAKSGYLKVITEVIIPYQSFNQTHLETKLGTNLTIKQGTKISQSQFLIALCYQPAWKFNVKDMTRHPNPKFQLLYDPSSTPKRFANDVKKILKSFELPKTPDIGYEEIREILSAMKLKKENEKYMRIIILHLIADRLQLEALAKVQQKAQPKTLRKQPSLVSANLLGLEEKKLNSIAEESTATPRLNVPSPA